VRFSLLPLEPLGRNHFWYGALEMGFEPLYQKYTVPKEAFWAGLAAVSRYHFLSLGRVVPYVEIGGSAGGTDLEIREINSAFAFLVFGGLGASDRKSTRLNSSHRTISYAVFCLKKKKNTQ